METERLPSWALPLIVAALVVPTGLGFGLIGPGAGIGFGGLTLVVLVVVAARMHDQGPLEVASAPGEGPLLVVALAPIDDPGVCREIAAVAEDGDPTETETEVDVLVIAPAQGKALARWLSDESEARFDAQRNLTISVASLIAAGLAAEGRVGDGDPMQAIGDALLLHGARAVVVFLPVDAEDGIVERLRARLDRPVARVGPPPLSAGPRAR